MTPLWYTEALAQLDALKKRHEVSYARYQQELFDLNMDLHQERIDQAWSDIND